MSIHNFLFILFSVFLFLPCHITAAQSAQTQATKQEYVITQKDDKGKIINTYHVSVYSSVVPLIPEQTREMMLQMQQQCQFQESFNKFINDTLQSFDSMYAHHFSLMNFPIY